MRISFFIVLFTMQLSSSFSQTVNVTWGEEFKFKKNSTDFEIIFTDNSGIYVKESHVVIDRLSFNKPYNESASLIKFNKDLTEVFSNDFNKELKGKDFERLLFVSSKLFLLASDYSKKENTLTLFATEIDKNSGKQNGEWKAVTSWQIQEKSEEVTFKVNCNSDSSKMVIVSTAEGKEKNSYQVTQVDAALNVVSKPVIISNEFDIKSFELEDVVYTNTGNVLIVGKVYEFKEGKKKKDLNKYFKDYIIRLYDTRGKLVKDISTAVSKEWFVSVKAIQTPFKDLVLTAFYSNNNSGDIDGILAQYINAQTGETVSSSKMEINVGAFLAAEDRVVHHERDYFNNSFLRRMRFQNISFTANGSIIVMVEKYNSYLRSSNTTTSATSPIGYSVTRSSYRFYDCDDILVYKIDKAGTINWLSVIPKVQREYIQIESNTVNNIGFMRTNEGFLYESYYNWPFFSGFGMFNTNDKIVIVFNDDEKNSAITQYGQTPTPIASYEKSGCYAITIDITNGKYSRSLLFNNKDVPDVMPRLGKMLGTEFYMIGEENKFFGKSKIALAKLSLNN